MARLSQSDFESLLGYLEEIRSFDGLAEFRAGILPGLRRLVPCDLVAYNELDPSRGEWSFAVYPAGYESRTNQDAFVRFMDQHPLIPYYLSSGGNGGAVQFADAISPRELHRLELYQEFFRPLEVEHEIVVQLPATLPRVIGIPLMRARRRFSERERLLLDKLRPHLVQGYLDARARTQMRRVLEAHEDGGAEDVRAVLLLDRSGGGVDYASGAGERWLDAYFDRAERRDRLPHAVADWVTHQRSRLHGASGPEPAEPLLQERGERSLRLRFLPGDGTDDPDAVLMIERRRRLSPAALRSLGLTPREAEVLARAARGGSYEEIGAELWISPGTVHKHLEHVYGKLGVGSRAAAVTSAFERLGAAA